MIFVSPAFPKQKQEFINYSSDPMTLSREGYFNYLINNTYFFDKELSAKSFTLIEYFIEANEV